MGSIPEITMQKKSRDTAPLLLVLSATKIIETLYDGNSNRLRCTVHTVCTRSQI